MALRSEIARLLQEGVRPSQIARRLGVAGTTVTYHVERIRAGQDPAPSEPRPGALKDAGGAVRRSSTRAAVALLLRDGLSRAETARRLGLTKSTVSYHARRLGEAVDDRYSRRYDWEAVQAFYDEGNRWTSARRGSASHARVGPPPSAGER